MAVGQRLLGAGGPRHYFVALENDAEMRDQGAILSYALVTIDKGHLTPAQCLGTVESGRGSLTGTCRLGRRRREKGFHVSEAPALDEVLGRMGGVAAPRSASAQLRTLLEGELRHGAAELSRQRSGHRHPVVVGFATRDSRLISVCPVDARVRVDPGRVEPRGWQLLAAATGAVVQAAGAGAAPRWSALALEAGTFGAYLTVALPSGPADLESGDAELAALAFAEQLEGVSRLQAVGVALPGHVLGEMKDRRRPSGRSHPLLVAEAVARLGGRPAHPASMDRYEDAVLELFAAPEAGRAGAPAPHDDSAPARRAARRILQRLNGMGKWGGFHTEFRYLARGFPADQLALALEVGERLVASGLLIEKISVGQRHVFLNPRRAKDIHRLIQDATVPPDLVLP